MIRTFFLLIPLLTLFQAITFGQNQTPKRADNGMGYLEYLPPNYPESGKQYPLLIFLHGSGERGSGSPSDLEKVKRQGVPKQIKNGQTMCFDVNGTQECFIVLSPQTQHWGWMTTVVQFTDFALENYPIDPDRVYVTGLSMGGKGSWQAGYTSYNEPNRFAALAPISADGQTALMPRIANYGIPVWAFHGDEDGAIPLSVGQLLIDALIAADPDPQPIFTIYEGYGHSASMWDKIYSTTNNYHSPNLYQWLLMQNLNSDGGNGGSQPDLDTPTNFNLELDQSQISVEVKWQNIDPDASEVLIQKKSESSGFSDVAVVSSSSSTFNDSEIDNQQSYTYRIKCMNENQSSSFSPEKNIYVSVDQEDEIIIDNTDSRFTSTGNWESSSYGGSDKYGFNYYHDNDSGKGSKSATFTASVTPGTYKVYGWWIKYSNRATNVKYEIDHANGTANLNINQKDQGNEWVLIGEYDFVDEAQVTLRNNGTNGYVIADAIRFVKTAGAVNPPQANPDEIILDNTSASTSTNGNWTTSTAGGNSRYEYNYLHDNNSGKGSKSVTFSSSLNGTYEVYGWWYAFSNRATNTPFKINHKNGSSTVTKNQRINNAKWVLLGTYEFDGTGEVTISNANTNGYVVADAVRFVKTGTASQPNELILDNAFADISKNGSWTTSTAGGSSRYEYNYLHDNNSNKGSKSITFSPSLTGTYEVFGWWFAYSNRATNTPFTIAHKNGSSTVTRNQRTNNAKWVSLGTYEFDGNADVTISNSNTNGYVVVDALRFVQAGQSTTAQGRVATDSLQTDAEDIYASDMSLGSEGLEKTIIFPNPVDEEMHVKIGGSHKGEVKVEVMDITGEIIYQTKLNNDKQEQFDLRNEISGMRQGMGIIRISSAIKSEVIRFVKK